MTVILEKANALVWGVPALFMIIGVGILLSVRTGFGQLRLFPDAMRMFLRTFSTRRNNTNNISPYRALCTALAATVGTGNLAGVAGAVAIGGPGAVFWMWMCALLGMVIKCAEVVLSVEYKVKNGMNEYVGGPMYIISRGMPAKWHFLASIYCFFGVVAAFGVGNATQINAVVEGLNSVLNTFGISRKFWIDIGIGIVSAALVGALLSGGARRIGKAAEFLVPFASLLYLLFGTGVLLVCRTKIPAAFECIFKGAFCPSAVTGGVIGSTLISLRVGASRGVFTNEAGMGTASIAHAAAQVSHPVEQGLMGIIEVFIDTILICTITALVIICSGVPVTYGVDMGVKLTIDAFSSVYGSWISVPLAIILSCFAFATVLGWGLYGVRCAQYLFGAGVWKKFIWISVFTVMVGAVLSCRTVWMFSETVNGLMSIPNLIAIAYLSPEFVRLIEDYMHTKGKHNI